MPYPQHAKTYRRRAPATRYRKRIHATTTKFMPRQLARKRYNNTSTRVMWFKTNGVETTGAATNFGIGYLNDTVRTATDWDNAYSIYTQYKILAMKVRWFPANVGIESDTVIFGTAAGGLLRGDNLVLNDPDNNLALPANMPISDGIKQGSARMINSRRPYSRTLYRPKGYPEWGDRAANDPWAGKIIKITNNASVSPAAPADPINLWYYTITYKVVFRGRTYV